METLGFALVGGLALLLSYVSGCFAIDTLIAAFAAAFRPMSSWAVDSWWDVAGLLCAFVLAGAVAWSLWLVILR